MRNRRHRERRNEDKAIAEAVQRPTMKFVATKTADQLDLQALHRVRARLVSQRTGIINQIRAFLFERGVGALPSGTCEDDTQSETADAADTPQAATVEGDRNRE